MSSHAQATGAEAKVGIIALSGYNTRAVIAFCRYAKVQDLTVHLVAKDQEDPIFHTEFRHWVFSVRTERNLNVDTMVTLVRGVKSVYGYERILFLPSSEFLNRFMLINRSVIEAEGVIVPLVGQELYEMVSDKYAFGDLCASYGMHVPAEVAYPTNELPIVAKPRTYASPSKMQLKPRLLFCQNDMDEFIAQESIDDYYFQEYIHGQSFYLLFYVSRSGNDVLYSQENLIQQSGGGSVICAVSSTLHSEPIANQYLEMLKRVGFFGLIMIELRKHDEKYYMIEANPRMWGPLQLVVDSNIPILKNFLKENGVSVKTEREDERSHTDEFHYFWAGGIVKDQNKGNSPTFHHYSQIDLVENFFSLMKRDIFLRNDTLNLYREEITGTISS